MLTSVEYTALIDLGTETWEPGGFHGWALAQLFKLFPVEGSTDEEALDLLSGIVRDVNTSEAPHELLIHAHWMLVNTPSALDAETFTEFCQMSSAHIKEATAGHLHPVGYMRLVDEGMPVEYATEAARLT